MLIQINDVRSQKGSTLIISMIILVVLMLLGATSMVTSDAQYRLAGNLQFEDMALNNAEAALVQAEAQLVPVGGVGATGLTSGTQMAGVTVGTAVLVSTGSRLQSSSQVIGSRASTGCNEVNTYTVTANGTSARGASKTVQSYYSVLAC
ncbi:MAG: hypothetical protein FD121_896 [Gallionellaceae bacterium]|nr:MAG: hypothetical protein FD121_896 [Gallionellaceae bacterium]